jgi:hypothetical protein
MNHIIRAVVFPPPRRLADTKNTGLFDRRERSIRVIPKAIRIHFEVAPKSWTGS